MAQAETYRQHTRSLEWGLNLDVPEVTTQEEIDEFRRVSAAQLGVRQDGLEFWLDQDPEVLKRYRLWANVLRIREDDEAPNKWSASGAAIMYLYSITGFEDGLRYSLHGMSRTLTKAQILEQIALVFRWAGPRGMATIGRAAQDQDWGGDPPDPAKWPKGWAPDPDAFKSGADFTTREASADDVRKILDWYERWLGEVPRHASFLARHRPDMLKLYRQRFENTVRLLPKQAEPWTALQICMIRAFGGGVREALLLGRAWGITKTQILEAISWGTFYGGQESITLVDEVAGDVIDGWPE